MVGRARRAGAAPARLDAAVAQAGAAAVARPRGRAPARDLRSARRAGAAAVAATGHALQVEDDRIAAPLFVIHGRERRRVLWDGEGDFVLRGVDRAPRPVADLIATVADNPAVVSPGVLLRPVVQDAVLGTALQLMGPGELAYLAQASAALRPAGGDGAARGAAPADAGARSQAARPSRRSRAHARGAAARRARRCSRCSIAAAPRSASNRCARPLSPSSIR